MPRDTSSKGSEAFGGPASKTGVHPQSLLSLLLLLLSLLELSLLKSSSNSNVSLSNIKTHRATKKPARAKRGALVREGIIGRALPTITSMDRGFQVCGSTSTASWSGVAGAMLRRDFFAMVFVSHLLSLQRITLLQMRGKEASKERFLD